MTEIWFRYRLLKQNSSYRIITHKTQSHKVHVKALVSVKKSFGTKLMPDTETSCCFWFQIPKPGFGHRLQSICSIVHFWDFLQLQQSNMSPPKASRILNKKKDTHLMSTKKCILSEDLGELI